MDVGRITGASIYYTGVSRVPSFESYASNHPLWRHMFCYEGDTVYWRVALQAWRCPTDGGIFSFAASYFLRPAATGAATERDTVSQKSQVT